MGDGMATDDLNFVGVRRGMLEQRLKNRKKPDNFRGFWPGFSDGAADCSTPGGRFG